MIREGVVSFAAADVRVIDHAMATLAASFVDFETLIASPKPTDYEPIVSFLHGMTDLTPSLLR